MMSVKRISSAVKFAGDFAAGTIGSTLNQWTNSGKVKLGESLWEALPMR